MFLHVPLIVAIQIRDVEELSKVDQATLIHQHNPAQPERAECVVERGEHEDDRKVDRPKVKMKKPKGNVIFNKNVLLVYYKSDETKVNFTVCSYSETSHIANLYSQVNLYKAAK